VTLYSARAAVLGLKSPAQIARRETGSARDFAEGVDNYCSKLPRHR